MTKMSDMNDAAPADDEAHEADQATGAETGTRKGRGRATRSAGGMDARYLKELQAFLEAEAEMERQGVDLLADPEYRSLRELYIDGDIDQQEFVARVEALAESRPEDEDVSFTALDEAEAALAGDDELGDDDEPFGVDNDV
jgi:hypothetical protein